MVLRRRRYQSLGLLKRSHSRASPLEGVGKFVSESQVNDAILYNRVSRARPQIRELEFANEDVDWPLEYFCGTLGKWMRSLAGWLLGILESFMRFLGFRRKDDDNDKNKGTGKNNDRFLSNLNHSSGDGGYYNNNNANQNKMRLFPGITWRYENCVPFVKRRILKRKWFLNPSTREWALRKEESFQKHVTRGFRTLCSAVGKDTRIYVVCSAKEANNSTVSSSPQTFMFRADSKVLKAHSVLFRQWFEMAGNEKQVVTSFVTPQEMQAVLVYMYTLTWPTDMIVPKTKEKGVTFNPAFLAVLRLHGMSLRLTKETPPEALLRQSNLLAMKVVKEDNENENALPEEKNVLPPVTNASSEGQGDCSQFVQTSTDIIEYVSEKGSPNTRKNDLPTVSPPEDLTSPSDRGSKVKKRTSAKQSLNFSIFPSNRHRVHPETTSSSSECSKVKSTAKVVDHSSVVTLAKNTSATKNDDAFLSRLDTSGFHIG